LKKPRTQTAALLLWAMLLALGAAGTARAQGVTTSAITGRVSTEAGEPAAGAQVTATNTATGAVSRAVTRGDGRYLVPGLQPGTYNIAATRLGSTTARQNGVTLTLGQTAEFNFTLAAAAVALEGITATAERNSVLSREHTGVTTTVSDSTLRRAPTITRDLQDFTRLVPQIAVVNTTTGAVSAGGRNNRYNQLQIDGTASNDLFGLSASGAPSGQAGGKAITLEAVQEFQVVLAPFDVRQNGFTGASVNAITKSGTNRFTGTISAFHRNEGLAGRYLTSADTFSSSLDEFKNTEIAGSFGGPILRNKAFFFFAGERTDRSQPPNFIAGDNPALGVTSAQAEQVRAFLESLGYDAGGVSGRTIERGSTNLFGRLDVNLSQNNRLTLRHNFIDGARDDFASGSRSYYLSNAGYSQVNTTNSTLLQLNSGFGGGFFNELRVGWNRVRDHRDFEGDPFPRVAVTVASGTVVNAGTENFSGRNELDQDALEITNDLMFSLGSHNLTVGTNNEFSKFRNLFVRNPFGTYTFQSFADLQAGRASRYEFSYLVPDVDPATPGDQPGEPEARFKVNRYSLYAQDRWDASDNLQLTFGLRLERPTLPEDPVYNPAVENLYGRRTDKVASGYTLVNPRFGFNWDITGDGTTQLRGGGGTFSGRTPFVWISNAYGNTGLEYVRFTCDRTNTNNNDDPPPFVTDPTAQPRGCVTSAGVPVPPSAAPNEINLINPSFKMPQVARFALGIDRQLPFGLVGTLEGLYTRTIHDVLYQNLRVQPDSLGRTVEGRPRYQTRGNTPGLGDVIDITNTDKGYAYNLTAQVQRPFRDGWDFSLAYTFSRSRDVNPVTSSQAISNWRFNLTQDDPNNPGLGVADNDIPHRIVGQVSRRLNWWRRGPTDLSLVYIGQSGQPYSYRYNDDINFDGSFGNDLLYVPRDVNDIRFLTGVVAGQTVTPLQSWQNLNDFINRVECLRENRGQVLERNSCRTPWQSRFDFRLAQNLTPTRGSTLQVTLDILNVANLLNNEWGLSQFIGNQAESLLALATGTGVNNQPDANGRRLYRAFGERQDIFTTSNLDSRYQIQLGVRYLFQ
jgi:hypothetical protein